MPELAAEARQRVQVGGALDRRAADAKQEALLAARRFFTATNEEACIRPLAIQLGYLGASAQVDVSSQGQVRVRCQGDVAVPEEGARSARDGDYVRGTRLPFPIDGPDCKYSALFDPRSFFDALGGAFIVFADANSQAILFLRLLQERGAAGANAMLFDKVRRWIESASSEAPAEFGVRAWSAYLACVREGSFFFLSMSSLQSVCRHLPGYSSSKTWQAF